MLNKKTRLVVLSTSTHSQSVSAHFLSNPSESIRRARLRAQAKIDAELKLRRSAHKDKWGIALDYSYRWAGDTNPDT